jgi:hypothetical protein
MRGGRRPTAGARANGGHVTTELQVDTDPAEVGFDPGRLTRLDRRLARWVDEGRLPGFLVTVAR